MRRPFQRLGLTFAAISFATASLAAARPNFIIIFTDDQGCADFGAQGVRDDLKTPPLDALAAEHPDKVTDLRAKLDTWTQQLRPPGLPKNGIQRERQWYEHFFHHAAASPP